MKHSITLILFSLQATFLSLCYAQNCSTSSNLLTYYQDDIRSLANEYMWQTQQDTTEVQIPSSHFNFVAEKVSAIFNLQNNAVRDSIFDKYCIHDVMDVHQSKQIRVFIDPNQAWTEAWMNYNEISGNTTIDQFISSNNLTIESYVELPYVSSYGSHYVVLSSPISINYTGAINWLNQQTGINQAQINTSFGGAGKISFYQDANNSHISFTQEWSDCGDGCDNMITWYFEVDNNCNVNYVGRNEFHVWATWPDAPETDCNITLSNPGYTIKNINIYPNPFEDYIEISDLNLNCKYSIFNSHGQKIKEGEILSGYNKINTSFLSKGVYLLKINNETFKIIK